MTDALATICVGCGKEIVGGRALMNTHGMFHDAACVRDHYRQTVATAKQQVDDPKLAQQVEDALSRLNRGLGDMACDAGYRTILRLAAKLGEAQKHTDEFEEAAIAASCESQHWQDQFARAERALAAAVDWADRHGKEPDWLEDARALSASLNKAK